MGPHMGDSAACESPRASASFHEDENERETASARGVTFSEAPANSSVASSDGLAQPRARAAAAPGAAAGEQKPGGDPCPEPGAGCGGGLTYDQALTQYVGECGRGQVINFVLASSLWIPNAVLILLLVFSLGNPVKSRHWECADAADAACQAALAAADPAAGFCGLARAQWRWTRPGESLIANFDLVCAGEACGASARAVPDNGHQGAAAPSAREGLQKGGSASLHSTGNAGVGARPARA